MADHYGILHAQMRNPLQSIDSAASTSEKWGFRCKSPLVARDHDVTACLVKVLTGHLQRNEAVDDEPFSYGIAFVIHKDVSKRAACKISDFILHSLRQVGVEKIKGELVPLKGTLVGFLNIMFRCNSDDMPPFIKKF